MKKDITYRINGEVVPPREALDKQRVLQIFEGMKPRPPAGTRIPLVRRSEETLGWFTIHANSSVSFTENE